MWYQSWGKVQSVMRRYIENVGCWSTILRLLGQIKVVVVLQGAVIREKFHSKTKIIKKTKS